MFAGEKTEDEADKEYDEEDGFYFDGTYTGITTISESTSALPTSQQRYYQSLLEHFDLLRRSLRGPPSAAAVAALGESRPITLPSSSSIARDAWERHMLTCDPHPVQIASIDSDSMLELVKLMGKRLAAFLDPGMDTRPGRVGSWIWALLARCPDRGELGAEEVAELRMFATTAAKILEGGCEVTGVDAEGSDETDDEDGELGAAVREALMARAEMKGKEVQVNEASALSEMSVSKEIILDTIVTVIGEVYGQRDLLQYRVIWTEDTPAVGDRNQVPPG